MAITYDSVVKGGKGYTTVTTTDGRQVTVKGTRSTRNNNPGNLEYGSFAKKHGAIGSDGRFAVFPDREIGLAAMQSLVFDSPSYKNLSIKQAISRYAPPHENNTKKYAQKVASAIGVSVDTKISDIPSAQRTQVVSAMAEMEGLRPAKVFEAGKMVAVLDPKTAAPTKAVQRGALGGLLSADQTAPVPAARPAGLLANTAPSAMALAPTAATAPAQAAIAQAISRPAPAALSPAREANLASRLGPRPAAPGPLSPAQEANLASRLGPAPAAAPPATRQSLNAAQEKNLADRLGVAVKNNAMSPTKEANVMGRLNAAEAVTPSVSIGGLLGISPAGAATLTPDKPATRAPASPAASTGFAGALGSPRSMEATMGGPLAANRMSPAMSAPAQAPSPQAAPAAAPMGNMMGLAGSPRTAQQQSMASLDAENAIGAGMFTGAPPAMSPAAALAADVADQRKSLGLPALSAPVNVASPAKTYNVAAVEDPAAQRAPQNIPGAIGQAQPQMQSQMRSQQPTGLGLPSVPDAPSGFAQARSQIGNYASQNAGSLIGGLLGAAALGPIGGLLGGWAGRSIQRSGTTQPSALAQALGKAGLIGGLVDGGIGYGSGGYGLGAPSVPDAPTGPANYDTSRGGGSSGNASQAAKDNAGKGRGLY